MDQKTDAICITLLLNLSITNCYNLLYNLLIQSWIMDNTQLEEEAQKNLQYFSQEITHYLEQWPTHRDKILYGKPRGRAYKSSSTSKIEKQERIRHTQSTQKRPQIHKVEFPLIIHTRSHSLQDLKAGIHKKQMENKYTNNHITQLEKMLHSIEHRINSNNDFRKHKIEEEKRQKNELKIREQMIQLMKRRRKKKSKRGEEAGSEMKKQVNLTHDQLASMKSAVLARYLQEKRSKKQS